MHGRADNLAALAICCSLVLASGCAQTAESVTGFVTRPFKPKTAEEALHIKTPEGRRKELRELAKTAGQKSAAEQEQVARDLAAEIRNESDPLMRRQILRAAAACQTPLGFAIVVGGTNDSDLEVRRVACHCLGTRGGPEAVQELVRVANSDTDADVRIAAIRALGETRDSKAMPVLAEALADLNPAVQHRARESLRSVSGRDYGENVEAWREYAKTGKTNAAEVGLAERFRQMFY
jgi:HEAT repeat protein